MFMLYPLLSACVLLYAERITLMGGYRTLASLILVVLTRQALAEALLFEANFAKYRFLPDPRMVS